MVLVGELCDQKLTGGHSGGHRVRQTGSQPEEVLTSRGGKETGESGVHLATP